MISSRYLATTVIALTALAQLHTTTAASAVPSIKLGFNVHRSTMAMYGSTSFDIYVKPVVSGYNVSFDGKATFEQDGVVHNFYLVDSVPYHEVVTSSVNATTCLPIENIPSVPAIFEAIASATPVSSVNTDQVISCNNGTWLSTYFAGEPYVLCTGAEHVYASNFVGYGEDLSVSFEFLSDEVEFQSCVGDLDASKFDTTYASTWYAAKLNHADTTFHDGDGLFSSAQKPLKWFECLL
ncbi:hypothetical protein Pcac1_g9063 [Phytophthora cactorum]|nr:hypothetical protein Pcac1_g9063 [Phytophthora cactorum]KAG3004813.1 hypothetical protein PC120_g18332 [Phytophthora cactorum]